MDKYLFLRVDLQSKNRRLSNLVYCEAKMKKTRKEGKHYITENSFQIHLTLKTSIFTRDK